MWPWLFVAVTVGVWGMPPPRGTPLAALSLGVALASFTGFAARAVVLLDRLGERPRLPDPGGLRLAVWMLVPGLAGVATAACWPTGGPVGVAGAMWITGIAAQARALGLGATPTIRVFHMAFQGANAGLALVAAGAVVHGTVLLWATVGALLHFPVGLALNGVVQLVLGTSQRSAT